MAKYFSHSLIVGPSDENDSSAADFSIGVVLPLLWKFSPRRRLLDAHPPALAMRQDVARRLTLQGRQRCMFKSRPDLLLPFAVVAFYCILKAVLADWRKDCHDAQTQTEADEAT